MKFFHDIREKPACFGASSEFLTYIVDWGQRFCYEKDSREDILEFFRHLSCGSVEHVYWIRGQIGIHIPIPPENSHD